MGYSFSRAQMEDYKELVKDRFSEEAIEFLYVKFHKAAPEGVMTPVEFKRYIDSTGVYKNYRQTHLNAPLPGQMKSASGTGGGAGSAAAKKTSTHIVDREMYLHLFRAYDRDCDGVISFREFLLYHLAVMYSTEELFVVVFNAYDDDQDGYLSLADIVSTITAATRYVGDCDVEDEEVQRVIEEEAQRLMFFLDVRKDGRIRRDDMRLITQKHPEVLEKMKNLM
ncbi:calcium-binding protein CML [Trypanosoma conorhini]|uniref:Calcium-binding protein CML n=1 Tax=Trypanosoma conorhini TaxID=83891 RepID=A0A422NI91_9TRYP|nr:calcium-binding protein CML [Trypanosoma conorhini]RNF05171.1 calcium-binding protein CML [Trypanosoma conorhini]